MQTTDQKQDSQPKKTQDAHHCTSDGKDCKPDRELDAGKDVYIDSKKKEATYRCDPLEVKDMDTCPLKQFQKWFENAHTTEKDLEYNAVVLSTLGLEGYPNSRYVLLKEVSKGGFVFFTNYDSVKGKEIAANPKVSLTFYWPTQNHQIRIRGSS